MTIRNKGKMLSMFIYIVVKNDSERFCYVLYMMYICISDVFGACYLDVVDKNVEQSC